MKRARNVYVQTDPERATMIGTLLRYRKREGGLICTVYTGTQTLHYKVKKWRVSRKEDILMIRFRQIDPPSSPPYSTDPRPNFIKKDEKMTKENNDLINCIQAERGVKTCVVMPLDQYDTLIYKVQIGMTLEVGDHVLVPSASSHKFKVARVTEVHDEARFELDSNTVYRWVAQKLDLANYNALLDEEQSIREQLRRAAAFERLKRITEAAGLDLSAIKTPLLSSPNEGTEE